MGMETMDPIPKCLIETKIRKEKWKLKDNLSKDGVTTRSLLKRNQRLMEAAGIQLSQRISSIGKPMRKALLMPMTAYQMPLMRFLQQLIMEKSCVLSSNGSLASKS